MSTRKDGINVQYLYDRTAGGRRGAKSGKVFSREEADKKGSFYFPLGTPKSFSCQFFSILLYTFDFVNFEIDFSPILGMMKSAGCQQRKI